MYLPRPPRVWSRVQNQCTFFNETDVTTPYRDVMIAKGNVLQYKKNSSNLTQKQKYTQICKGLWSNRTKSYATQTQTYTNPNTKCLLRVNYDTVAVPAGTTPTYIPGPIHFNIPTPNGCPLGETVKDGGSLLCNTVANPCTDEIIEITRTLKCYPTTCSDVPGRVQDLCWDPRLAPWYPRQRYIMPTSGTGWPEGYKGFVSALAPTPPVVTLETPNLTEITLSWTAVDNPCIPISQFNVFINNRFNTSVSSTTRTVTIQLIETTSVFVYITSVSNTTSSNPSNVVYSVILPFNTTGTETLVTTVPNVQNYCYAVFKSGTGTITTNATSGTLYIICVGGGGSGGWSTTGVSCGGGGGGGVDYKTISLKTVPINTVFNVTVGNGAIAASMQANGSDSHIKTKEEETKSIATGGTGGTNNSQGLGGGYINSDFVEVKNGGNGGDRSDGFNWGQVEDPSQPDALIDIPVPDALGGIITSAYSGGGGGGKDDSDGREILGGGGGNNGIGGTWGGNDSFNGQTGQSPGAGGGAAGWQALYNNGYIGGAGKTGIVIVYVELNST